MSGVAHEVTNVGHDRDQLANMAKLAKAETAEGEPLALADRGCNELGSSHGVTRTGLVWHVCVTVPNEQRPGKSAKPLIGLVGPEGFEPSTNGLRAGSRAYFDGDHRAHA